MLEEAVASYIYNIQTLLQHSKHSKPTKFMFTPEDLFWKRLLPATFIIVKLCCSTSIVFDIIVDQLLIKFDLSLANERNKVIIETYVLPILQLVWKIPQYLNVIDNEESQVDHSR